MPMSASWKALRVIIIITFRDLHAERDHLVRFVFPRLHEELLKHRLHFVDVDLRWDVASEQDAMEVCREVVSEGRPRFVCLLGGRYSDVNPGGDLSVTIDTPFKLATDGEVGDTNVNTTKPVKPTGVRTQ